MASPARIKQLSSAHAYLRSAARYVLTTLPPDVPAATVALGEVESVLTESLLISCMDALVVADGCEAARGGFWRDLQRAAEALGLVDQATSFHARFLETLDHGPDGKADEV